MAFLWMEIAVILCFSILAYLLSAKVRQPVSLGLILAGVLIGMLHLASFADIQSIAQLGGIILLFLVGLQSNFREIYTMKAATIAVAGVAFPFVVGYIVSILLGFASPAAFIIASALTATGTGVTVAVLKELGKIQSEPAKLILGATVIDDVLGLLLLSASPTGISVSVIALTAVKAALFILIAVLLADHLLPKLVDAFDVNFGITVPKVTFMAGMLIAFSYSFIAESIGLSAIVGAFMAGISLSRSLNAAFFQSGAEFLEAVFTSIFFISLGIMVNVYDALSGLSIIIAITAVAMATKIIACGYVAKKLGASFNDALIVGVGMVPRSEVTFIMALYGLTLGVITPQLYTALVSMTFLTTFIAPPLLKHLFERDRSHPHERNRNREVVVRGRANAGKK